MANRLSRESSPYLLQHQHNPVDWHPWGEEAFRRARDEDKPIFLSVGYSSCHWCHVMEHESFEDDEVAAALNRDFVSVKVDREERPDVDEAYMTAVQLMSGRGGWPMSAFLTPDRRPFFAGTYFPKHDRGDQPGFLSVLGQLANAWKERRADLVKASREVAQAVTDSIQRVSPTTSAKLDIALVEDSIRANLADFDPNFGGFAGAPKFPPHTAIELLLMYCFAGTPKVEIAAGAIGAAIGTLQAMALGGIHDMVGGGFHRYSTDERWLLPHFEKTLYDNALMLSNYSLAVGPALDFDERLGGLFDLAATRTMAWMQTELVSPTGLFYAALDADSEGEEGRYYVWNADRIGEILESAAPRFLEAFHCLDEGNYADEATGKKDGTNVLWAEDRAPIDFVPELERLEEARRSRPRPAVDDKSIVSWNGLAVLALAQMGSLEAASAAANAILEAELRHGRLPHQIVRGEPSGDGFLDDYACLAQGLFRLGQVTEVTAAMEREARNEGGPAAIGEQASHWYDQAKRLTDVMVDRFYDEKDGGFYATTVDHELLFGRSMPVFDQPVPSGNAIAIRCLLAVGDESRALKSLNRFIGWMERAPTACQALVTTALMAIAEPADTPEPEPVPPVVQPTVPAAPKTPTARLSSREICANPDGWADGAVELDIPDGLHVNSSDPPAKWLTPTSITIEPLPNTVSYPELGDEWGGLVMIPFRVRVPKGSHGEDFEVSVRFQACTASECLAPETVRLSGVAIT